MSYITIDAEIDTSNVLPEIDTKELIKELKKRDEVISMYPKGRDVVPDNLGDLMRLEALINIYNNQRISDNEILNFSKK